MKRVVFPVLILLALSVPPPAEAGPLRAVGRAVLPPYPGLRSVGRAVLPPYPRVRARIERRRSSRGHRTVGSTWRTSCGCD